MAPNQFKNSTPLKVIRDSQDIADIIGRPAHEHLKRVPPKFDEDKKHLINFKNPCIRWVFTCYKVVHAAKGKSIFG